MRKSILLAVGAHLVIFGALALRAATTPRVDLSSFFHHKKHELTPPASPLSFDSDTRLFDQDHLTRMEEIIITYQAVRDSLPVYEKDRPYNMLESAEIKTVKDDLTALKDAADDPEKLETILNRLVEDVDKLVARDELLHHVHTT